MALMWRTDPHGNRSPEMEFCLMSTKMSALFGVVLGAVVNSKETFQKFMTENKHEMFKHPFEAQRALQVFISDDSKLIRISTLI